MSKASSVVASVMQQSKQRVPRSRTEYSPHPHHLICVNLLFIILCCIIWAVPSSTTRTILCMHFFRLNQKCHITTSSGSVYMTGYFCNIKGTWLTKTS